SEQEIKFSQEVSLVVDQVMTVFKGFSDGERNSSGELSNDDGKLGDVVDYMSFNKPSVKRAKHGIGRMFKGFADEEEGDTSDD
ncbi:hypothetical protein BGZ58_003606, partial [Dissophora ornata]